MAIAIVTGAGSARGIGRATALRLADAGWDLALVDVDHLGTSETEALVRAGHDVRALSVGCDVTSSSQVAEAVAEVERAFGRIDALINNAGISRSTPLLDITEQEWGEVFDVNAKGTFLFTQAVVPTMQRQRSGRIVNLSSVAAKRGGGVFGTAHYAAAKAAVLGFTRAVAREVAPFGITCNAVAPSMIDTDITGAPLSDEQKQSLAANVPLGRIGTANEVAAVIAFLCSDEASYVTGEIVDVNGGLYID